MKLMKKGAALILATVIAFSLCSCGCFKNSEKIEEIVVASQVTGGEVVNELWNVDLDASAAFISGYHATEIQEVLNNWKQAHMQKNDQGIVNGNGALIYAICSPDLRPRCLEIIKQNGYGSWNFYYNAAIGTSDQTLVPQQMLFSQPEKIEEDDLIRYIVEVSEITYSGETQTYQLYIDFIDGGYYLSGKSSPYTEMAVDDAEAGYSIGQ